MADSGLLLWLKEGKLLHFFLVEVGLDGLRDISVLPQF